MAQHSIYRSSPETRTAFCAEPILVLNFMFLAHKKLPNDQKSKLGLPRLIFGQSVIKPKKCTKKLKPRINPGGDDLYRSFGQKAAGHNCRSEAVFSTIISQ
jgi:hypothetical protein